MSRGTTLVKLLDDLRAECRISLNPAHNRQQRDVQVKMLQRKQEWLWNDFAWPHLRVERFIDLQAGQRYYDMPDDLDLERISKIEARQDSVYLPLEWGIGAHQYALYDSELGVRADAIRTAIPCVTAIAIPYDVVQDFHTVCTLQSDALLRALTMAVITADPSSNVVTHCVHVVIADDMLTVVGASPNLGVTHTRATIAPIDTAIDILLPRGIAQLLGGVLDGTTFTLLQDDKQNQVAFRCGNTTFHTVLGGGTYPDAIEGIVATRPTTTCMASIKGLESILGLIRQSKTERDTTTRAVLVLSPTVLHVKAPGRGYAGKSEARFPIELVGKPVTIECNADEMLDVLRAIRGTTIDLGITDRGFIRVTSPDDLGMVHVASPIRVEWEKTEE